MFSSFPNSVRFYAVNGHDNSLAWYTCFLPQKGQGSLRATFASRVLFPASSVVTPRLSNILKFELSNTSFLSGQTNMKFTSFESVITKKLFSSASINACHTSRLSPESAHMFGNLHSLSALFNINGMYSFRYLNRDAATFQIYLCPGLLEWAIADARVTDSPRTIR